MKKTDSFRIEACRNIEMGENEWYNSTFFQKPANICVYENYINTFKSEFTRLTKNIPLKEQVSMFPFSLITPSKVKILIGRDGIVFKYLSFFRPEKVKIIINQNKIIDELLLPHPSGKNYFITGPGIVQQSICSIDSCIYKYKNWVPDIAYSKIKSHNIMGYKDN